MSARLQEKDYAIFALVDAVSAAIGSCRLSADWEEGVLPAIDEIVDSMNDLFLGKAYAHRTASEFVSSWPASQANSHNTISKHVHIPSRCKVAPN
jgi:hypothetical protein